MPRGYTGVTVKETSETVKRGKRGRFEKGTKPGPRDCSTSSPATSRKPSSRPLRRPGAAMASPVTSTTKPSGTTRHHS